MKRYIGLAVTVVLGGVSLGSAQETKRTTAPVDEGMAAEVSQEAAPWRIQGGLVYKNWLYEHDALQQRAPVSVHGADDWRNGDTQGSGWGLQTRIGRGDGTLDISFLKSDFKYELKKRDAQQKVYAYHRIDTISRDFEPSWSQIQGRNGQAEWGSTLGFRYLGMQKDDAVTEGSRSYEGSGNMNWLMLLGGYNGNWRPFDTPVVQAHGSLLFFLGEAKGTARNGSDTNWTDGVVSETYSEQYSLAYGARASFGVDIAVTKRVRLSVDYMREWLYSFDATDTGIVVFPDNNDALFVENHNAVVASLNYLF